MYSCQSWHFHNWHISFLTNITIDTIDIYHCCIYSQFSTIIFIRNSVWNNEWLYHWTMAIHNHCITISFIIHISLLLTSYLSLIENFNFYWYVSLKLSITIINISNFCNRIFFRHIPLLTATHISLLLSFITLIDIYNFCWNISLLLTCMSFWTSITIRYILNYCWHINKYITLDLLLTYITLVGIYHFCQISLLTYITI